MDKLPDLMTQDLITKPPPPCYQDHPQQAGRVPGGRSRLAAAWQHQSSAVPTGKATPPAAVVLRRRLQIGVR
jgi:hypothetical protein